MARQLALGAVALKVHPVHGGFSPADPALYPAYQCAPRACRWWCTAARAPSPAPERLADPVLLDAGAA